MEKYSYFKKEAKIDNSESKFLQHEGHREDVYEASINLASFIKENNIPNVMFLDKSARQAYIGLQEAWKKIGDKQKSPHIYFINPSELRGEDDFSYYEKEFRRVYKNINPQDKILLYDACIHSGDTLFATKNFLEYLGFSNVLISTTSISDDFPENRHDDLDLVCLDHRARAGCHPFGRPLYIEKDGGKILSQRVDSDSQRKRASVERDRIRDVFNKNL